MVIAPTPLRFWLPIVIRPSQTFFSYKIFAKNNGIFSKHPRERFSDDETEGENCRKHNSLAILSYSDSPRNLGEFIYFHLLSWSYYSEA